MSTIPSSLLIRVGCPLVREPDGKIERDNTACVVLHALDSHEWLMESETILNHCGWVVYWFHPRSHAVGLLYVLSATGGRMSEPWDRVWMAVEPVPHELVRRTALAWLAYDAE